MDMQTMKIAFVEEFLKLKDETIIKKLLTKLRHEKQKYTRKSIEKFTGILNDEEAKDFLEAAQECRKIDIDEW